MQDFKKKVISAELMEQAGRYAEAERAYLDIISALNRSDLERLGGLHINLGQLMERQERWRDAVRYYIKAIELLDGLSGESGLQYAHAHYNVARILRVLGDARYEEFAHKALVLYRESPLASSSDENDVRRLLKPAWRIWFPYFIASILLIGVITLLLIFLF